MGRGGRADAGAGSPSARSDRSRRPGKRAGETGATVTRLPLGASFHSVKVPPDPPEMATWRALAERRDELVAKVRFGADAVKNAKRAVDAMREQYGNELPEARYLADEEELRESFERQGAEASEKLELLDAAITSRPLRGGPPTKLLDDQGKELRFKALRAVKAYIAKPSATTGAWAWMCLCAVAGRVLSNGELDSLIEKARRWKAENPERSGTLIAPLVVNTAAGLAPTSRKTRG